MPRVESTVIVPVPPEIAFAVSQTQGEVRYRWDTFVRHQELLDGATEPAKGVQTLTRSRHFLKMVSEYTSIRPPNQVGMRLVKGPWFFATFGAGWSFSEAPGGAKAVWRYTFSVRPKWLAPVGNRIGLIILQRDINRRLAGFAKGCEDLVVLASIRRD